MNPTEILVGIIVLLVGILIGGTGGQAIIRRAVGSGDPNSNNASVAAAAAASAAATAASSLNQHIGRIQESVDKQWDTLDKIRDEETRLATAFEGFPEICKLKHEAIEREQNQMREEIGKIQGGRT